MNTMTSPCSADNNAIAAMVRDGGNDVAESCSEESSTNHGLRTPDSERSLELRGTIPMAERFQGKSHSLEKVLDKSRRIKRVAGIPGVGTDDTESFDQKFAADIKEKAILLQFACWNEQSEAVNLCNPKMGILKFATCKHNLATDINDDGVFETCLAPHTCVLANRRSARITFPNTGWRKRSHHEILLRDGITWSHGFDISLGPVVYAQTGAENWPNDPVHARILNGLVSNLKSFDLVDENFLYEEGLKIGIVAYNPRVGEDAFSEVGGPHGINILRTWAIAVKGFNAAKIGAVGREKEDVMIYTGIITKDGNDHIEYNANSYKGCSGAIVIVMDRSHPDFGKAIAIHGGYKPALVTNLGFKLAGNFDRPW